MKLLVKGAEVVEAYCWWQNGDHPEDNYPPPGSDRFAGGPVEGALVRRYRVPGEWETVCGECGNIMHDHGWLEPISQSTYSRDGLVVCPGAWVLTTNDEYSRHAVIDHETLLNYYVAMDGVSPPISDEEVT